MKSEIGKRFLPNEDLALWMFGSGATSHFTLTSEDID